MKTVLVTGCSSGYGLATALHFHAQGWRVIAAMRTPTPELLPVDARMQVVRLDVTDDDAIAAAVAAAGPIDVLVNNAGVGLLGAVEATPMATVRDIFAVNTFGTIAMTRAVLPGMRAQGRGVIVHVTSSATMVAMPLVAVYTASKAAIEAFGASLALELAAFGVRVRLVEPGYGPGTRFTDNALPRMAGLVPPAYAAFAAEAMAAGGPGGAVTHASDVAAVVWRAAHDDGDTLRYPAGADAIALASGHR